MFFCMVLKDKKNMFIVYRYNIHKDTKSYCRYISIERWSNQELLTKHLKTNHVKKFGQECKKNGVYNSYPQVFFCGPPIFKPNE